MSALLRQHSNANQGLLETQLHTIFPSYNILQNARRIAAIKNPSSGSYLEVDLWVPEINLCFEFQDDYHYTPAWYSQTPLSFVSLKDNAKRSKMLEQGQTIVLVPYWWDGAVASLEGSICFQRPDLCLGNTDRISTNPPYLTENKSLMLASFPDDTNVIDLMEYAWWVGEKWDGIRCYWIGAEKQLYSRHGLQIELHPSVNALLSGVVPILDGELWYGRGKFHETQNFISVAWQRTDHAFLRFVCFDEASYEMNTTPFEERYNIVLSFLSKENAFVIPAPRFKCENEAVLLDMLERVVEGSGEGLILRQPNSFYLPGRSRSLLKIKASHGDQEALVVKVEDDGSLLLRLPNGFSFQVAQEDCLLPQRAVKGDIVTFSFDFFKRVQATSTQDQLPSNAVVHRIRYDLNWSDVVANFLTSPVRRFGNETHQSFDSRTQRYQDSHISHISQAEDLDGGTESSASSWKLLATRRAYFDQYAASKGMDPLNPHFWYTVSTVDLSKYRSGYIAISKYYGKTLSTTLMQLYPDIGLQESRFTGHQSWKHESDRRAYFEKFAASEGMDSLNPLFWYSVTAIQLKRFHLGIGTIVDYYGGKVSTALMKLYPNIGLQKNGFNATPQSWKRESVRREYFDRFAASKQADPLSPHFWYRVTRSDLMNFHRGYRKISEYYGGALSRALIQLYPDIGLELANFKEILG